MFGGWLTSRTHWFRLHVATVTRCPTIAGLGARGSDWSLTSPNSCYLGEGEMKTVLINGLACKVEGKTLQD